MSVRMLSLLFAWFLCALVTAKPLASKRWDDFELKHAWQDIPKGWEVYRPAPLDAVINMRIALKQDKFDDLVTSLYEVSEPQHEK